MKSIKDLIQQNTNEEGFQWGLDTVMNSLRPNCHYKIKCLENLNFDVYEWADNQWCDVTKQYLKKPTSQEIHDEYIRQQTIAECLTFFKEQ